MKNVLIINAIVLVCFLMLNCSDPELGVPNPGPTPGPTPGPKVTLTDEERLAVLKECSETIKLLGDLKQDAAQQILVAWLKSRPEFEEAGIESGNVWAYFYDGRVVIIVPNWMGTKEDTGGRIATSDPGGGRMGRSLTTARTNDLPKSNKVSLFYGLGKAFTDGRLFLKSLFDRSHTEYVADTLKASIENLAAVNDLGVFYISTHGGLGLLKPKVDRRTCFGLWTTDTTSVANEQKYTPELNSNMLVYMNAVEDDTTKTEWHYAITGAFARHSRFMNFAADPILYIDACHGMSTDSESFRTDMINAAANKKGTYIGWTNATNNSVAGPTSEFVFDRLLGTHDQTNNTIEPVQRPFDWPSIFDDLPTFGLGVLRRTGAVLAYFSIYSTKPILTPSIEYIWMSDYDSKMVIKGMFGEHYDEGKVTVDGKPATNIIWSPTMVIATIPEKGNGSYGDVIVSIRGHESNKVPLSEWTIPMNVSVDDMGVTTEAILTLKIRADVHPYRKVPSELPRTIRPDSLDMLSDPTNLGWNFNTSSTGTYSVAGHRQVSCNIEGGCYIRDTETVHIRSGNLPYDPLGSGLGFRAFYKWAEDMKTIYVTVMATIPNVGMELETYGRCPDQDDVTINQSYESTLGVSIPTEGIKHLEIKLNNYEVQTGRTSVTTPITWGRCAETSRIITAVSWSNAKPQSPPKPETDARTP